MRGHLSSDVPLAWENYDSNDESSRRWPAFNVATTASVPRQTLVVSLRLRALRHSKNGFLKKNVVTLFEKFMSVCSRTATGGRAQKQATTLTVIGKEIK